MPDEVVKRFAKLFKGNPRSYGQWNPKNGEMYAEKKKHTTKNFESHIIGGMGLGLVPILDNDSCYWGAIDIDAHGADEEIDLIAVEAKIRELGLPLIPCRSKSAGVHCYVFTDKPIKAAIVRSALARWANAIGYGGSEIFPKQTTLKMDNGGDMQLGNWINLCYHNGDETNRYALYKGAKLKLEEFIDLAESSRVTKKDIMPDNTVHAEAPPCIQKMIDKGVEGGSRNLAMYSIVVYLKKAFPDNFKEMAFDLNSTIFDTPLSHGEAKKVVSSASRRDYRYKCGEEPCKSRCKSKICVTRKYGITPTELGDMESMPAFENLKKIMTEPVRWELEVDCIPVILSTDEIMSFRKLRMAVAEKITKLIPAVPDQIWHRALADLMEKARIIDAPDEASTSGFIRAKLNEFVKKADLKSDGKDIQDRMALLRGVPVVQVDDDDRRMVYFRGPDFVDHLKRTKSEELKGTNLWMALRKIGVEHSRLRIDNGKDVINVWSVPVGDKGEVVLRAPDFKVEY